MSIQREYNLPNCKLVVEGFASEGFESSPRPPLSVVTQVECNFLGQEPVLTGGRSLLDSLVPVVSHYAQEFLSGVPHPHTLHGQHALDQAQVRIERLETDLHRLTVMPPDNPAATNGQVQTDDPTPLQVTIGTVQLFDLVEALDQLVADQQTIPDLTLTLAPVSRRYAVTHEPVGKRIVPAAIGLASLAATAIAFFFLPIPERRVEPEPTAQESPAASPNVAASPLASPEPVATDSPVAESPSPEATPAVSPETSPETSPEASPEADLSPSPTSEASPSPETEAEGLETVLAPDTEITNPEAVSQLQNQLRDRLDEAWTQPSDFSEDLIYRVRVAENGDILGFRYVNDAAVEDMDHTPLRDLQYNSTGNTRQEASAEFRVVFTPDGVVQVSPWHGRPTP